MVKDLRQTKNYANYMKSIGWRVEYFAGIYIYIRKILLGYVIKIQRPQKKVDKKLLSYLENKYKLSSVNIEPGDVSQIKTLIKYGFKKSKTPSLPSRSVWLDLTKTEEELLSQMHYKTRYNIKHGEKYNVNIYKSSDIKKFADFWQKSSLSWGMFLPEKKFIKEIYYAFGKDAHLFFAERQGITLGGILLISTEEISYYMYAAYSKEGKSIFVPTLLTWSVIKFAKSQEKKVFDFEGIYDDRYPLSGWIGFSRFKESFGGSVISYPGILNKIQLL